MHTLHKIFGVFNFVGKGGRQKIFNSENFAIYGTRFASLTDYLHYSYAHTLRTHVLTRSYLL